jgi:hypothetical protein
MPNKPPARKPPKLGIGWYTPETYAALLEVADDRDELPRTFDAWLRQAQKVLFVVRGKGLQPEQIFVDIEELSRWCRGRGTPIDGKNRAQFVSAKTEGLPTDKLKKI